MLPPKNLNLPATGAHPFNHAIYLIRLPARLSYLRHNNVGVEPAVRPRGELERAGLVGDGFHADQHVFLCVV